MDRAALLRTVTVDPNLPKQHLEAPEGKQGLILLMYLLPRQGFTYVLLAVHIDLAVYLVIINF